MLKVVALACALVGLLSAVSIESWLRRHTGNKEFASDVYMTTIEKYSEFWFSLIIPILITATIGGIFLAVGIGINSLIAYAAGVVISFLAVFTGSRSFVSGAVSASSFAAAGDIKKSMTSAYRSGAVMGLTTIVISIAALGLLVTLFNQDMLSSSAAAFGLGACVSGLLVRLTGAVLTSSHKLADSEESRVDYMGAFASNGANFTETYILAACSAVMLAEIGVETSGVTSTFSVATAAKFPIVIMSCGIVASVIGMMVYRAATGRYSHYGFTAGTIVSSLIVFGVSFYLSNSILEDRAYAYCIGFGLLAQILGGELSKSFAMDRDVFNRNMPKTEDDLISIPMLHGLSVGFISVVIQGLISAIALFLSFSIARYYGIALCAIGACSVAAVTVSVREYASVLSASASFSEKSDEKADENAGYYNILRRNSALSKISGKAYSSMAACLTLMSLLMTFTINANIQSADLTIPVVFGGMILGNIMVFMMLGLLIRSILNSTLSMLDFSLENPDEYRNVGSLHGMEIIELLAIAIPVIIGLVLGVNCLYGFIGATVVTGVTLVYAFNNTGRFYDRIAADVLSSIIKMMTAVSIVSIPAFMDFGGTFF